MNSPLSPQIALAVVRHVVGLVAGGLVSLGYVTSSEQEQVVGGAMVLVTVGLSIWDKVKARQAVKEALATPVPASLPTQETPFMLDRNGAS